MKKILCTLLCLLTLFSLTACGVNEQGTVEDDKEPEQTVPSEEAAEETDNDENGPCVRDLYGFRYAFPEEVLSLDSNGGTIYECGESSVLVFSLDVIDFSDWESVAADCQSAMFSSVSSAFSFYPSSQTISSQQQVKNSSGEELLMTTGALVSANGEKEFIAYYHVTADNKVRFFITLLDDNAEEATKMIEYVADHLAKV